MDSTGDAHDGTAARRSNLRRLWPRTVLYPALVLVTSAIVAVPYLCDPRTAVAHGDPWYDRTDSWQARRFWTDPQAVRQALQDGAPAYLLHPDGWTPLHSAVHWGNPEVVAVLMDAGAPVWPYTHAEGTPLHMAARRGDVPVLETILERGGGAYVRYETRITPLHTAVGNGQMKATEALLNAGAGLNVGWGGFQPLHAAVIAGDPAMIRLLLDRAADIQAGCLQGYTPLHFAVGRGRLDLVRLLVERGADVNARTTNQITPLHVAAMGSVTFTVEPWRSDNLFWYFNDVIRSSRCEEDWWPPCRGRALDPWLPYGGDWGLPETELSLEELEYLLDKGADPTVRTWPFGKTAIMYASDNPSPNHEEAVRLLAQRGASQTPEQLRRP